ncbi:MAG: hypothetical protein AB7V44_08655 [Pseudonocardia sp.]
MAAPDGAYDLAHDLVREAAYRHLSTPRRIMLHRSIGRALAIVPDDDILAADAARHADQADDGVICAAASAKAARRCVRLLAYDDAAEHVARGRRHARRLDARQRVVHEIRLIDVLLHPGLRLRDTGTLRTELAELCALARQLGLVDELSTALTLLARVYHWGWGDIPRAGALLQRSVDVISRADHPVAEPLLQAARCLAYLEIDMPRTCGLFDELTRLGELAEASHQYHWGRGLVLAWSVQWPRHATNSSRRSASPTPAAITGCSSNARRGSRCSKSKSEPTPRDSARSSTHSPQSSATAAASSSTPLCQPWVSHRS